MLINSTLCYIEREGCFLMLYRNKKEQDPSEGKWVGIGGKFEPGEGPEDCLLREVWEETGLTLTAYRFHGVIHFVSDRWDDEDMHLYTATGFEGADPAPAIGAPACCCPGEDPAPGTAACCGPAEGTDPGAAACCEGPGGTRTPAAFYDCSEGDLRWIPKEQVLSLNLWAGDPYFLEPLIRGADRIGMTCGYRGHEIVYVRNDLTGEVLLDR
ncbi:MAG: 8-oxo-dGTP diphosphatase [Lachnospiraceae bacterium]|nr:8-oxo-dGTP diphosphatase [Lachnospiraceae bacterium]